MMRYMIRKEFFGAYVYDGGINMYLLFDKDSFDTFKEIADDNAKFYDLDKDIQDLMEKEEFTINGVPNYYIVDNGDYENTLSAPMRLHLLYTEGCNLNCIHCFSRDEQHLRPKEMTFEEKVKILDEMNEIGMCEILIGGGEPFIKKDIFDFIRECNKRNIIVKIFSNGLLVNDKNFEEFVNMKVAYLAISVDGTTAENYKVTRGVDGFDTIKSNIKKLKAAGCKYQILISTTINSYNCDDPEGYLKFTDEVGADRLKIRGTKPNGNILINRDVMISAERYKEFLRTIQEMYNEKYSDRFKMDLTWGDFRLAYDEEKDELFVVEAGLPYDSYGCVAGKTAMCVNADGTGIPCGFLPEEFHPEENENVIKNSLLRAWHNGRNFIKLRNLKGNETCKNCDVYSNCRGGCIARIAFSGQDINGIDPWCIKKYFPIKIKK